MRDGGQVQRASAQPGRWVIDLAPEAARFFRRRFRVAGTGLVLGSGFVGLGAYETGLRAAYGLSTEYAVALLMVVLGLAVIAVSLYRGQLNPVTRIRADADGLMFVRRWGRRWAWSWGDPKFRVDIDEPSAGAEDASGQRPELYFEGPGSVYGVLTPSALAALVRAAETQGAAVSVKDRVEGPPGTPRHVRRVRIRPAPVR
jgi:hypothetical protein